MSVREVTQALGSWGLRLRKGTPKALLDVLSSHYFGHIAITPGRINVTEYGDQLLRDARYVGVYRARFMQNDEIEIKGVGMAFWLGDEDGKGDVLEAAVDLEAESFADTIRALLPPSGAVLEGDLHAVAGTYTGKHQWQTPRAALSYVTDIYSTDTEPVEWRVNGDATLDAGKVADLYNVDNPKAMLVRRGQGADLLRRAMPGALSMDADTEDYSTRLVLLAEGEGASTATGDADGPATPYNDLHGNAIKLTRLVSESTTSGANADARAASTLAHYNSERRAAQLSSTDYDVKGDLVVGDALDVFDPETGFIDPAREVYWQGIPINPMTLRCVELTWPVRAGWTVGFRDNDGAWYDLSDYFVPEGGDTNIIVGSFKQRLSGGGSGEPVGGRPVGDSSIPAAPVFGDFATGSYQPSEDADTKAFIGLTWTEPLNTDGSTVLDGDHYEIRYRPNATLPYPATWDEAATHDWDEVFTWDQPLVPPIVSTDWHIIYVGFDQEQVVVQELTCGVDYEFQIRAVDTASPPNKGAWSGTTTHRAARDQIPPETPAAPSVAGSRISIQITHHLGEAAGGTFNLAPDLDHLEIHVGGSADFGATDSSRIGRLVAGAALRAGVPVVGTFGIEDVTEVYVKVVAVDATGNKSAASSAATVSAELVDSAHISDLTVSKVTAGTISADWLIAALLATGVTGARLELDATGLRAYNTAGVQVAELSATSGDFRLFDPDGNETFFIDAATGEIQLGTGDGVTIQPNGSTPQITLTPPGDTGSHLGQLFAFDDAGVPVVQLQILDSDTLSNDGGKVLLSENGAILSHQPAGDNEAFLWFGSTGAGSIEMQGAWTFFQTSEGGVHAETAIVGAGFGALAASWGPTMVDVPGLAYSLGSAAANRDHCLTAISTTGYTVAWAGTEAHGVRVWAWREA